MTQETQSNPEGRFHIVNLGPTTLTVPIVHSITGAQDEVFLQPGGKPMIPFGYEVDASYLIRNARVLRVVSA